MKSDAYNKDKFVVCEEALINLVKLAGKGNEKAFEQIIKLYENKVFSMAMYMLKNREDALDISQEVFVKLYKTISNLHEPSSLKTYIMTLCRNACLDEIRRREKTKYVPLEYENDDGESQSIDIKDDSCESNPEKYYQRKEKIEIVRKAIGRLDEDKREMIILRDINNLGYDEISTMTGLAIGTVKSRINRARQEIKNLLKEWNYF